MVRTILVSATVEHPSGVARGNGAGPVAELDRMPAHADGRPRARRSRVPVALQPAADVDVPAGRGSVAYTRSSRCSTPGTLYRNEGGGATQEQRNRIETDPARVVPELRSPAPARESSPRTSKDGQKRL